MNNLLSMKKLILFIIFLIIVLSLTSCSSIVSNQVNNLDKASEQVVCSKPYIKYNNACCLDQNINSICDTTEEKSKQIAAPPIIPIKQAETIVGRCILQPGISCLDYKVTANQILFVLQNSLGYDISSITIAVANCGAGTGPVTLANGGIGIYTIACASEIKGTKYDGRFDVTYIAGTSTIAHTNKGQITAGID